MHRFALAHCAVLALPLAGLAEPVDFNRDVRPILSDVCFQCHGPDNATREAELRLDERAGLFDDRDGHRVVVPAKPGESAIIARITSDDPDERMPPQGFAKQLSDEQIDVIRRWIAEGAEWKGHWAYVPAAKPAVPAKGDEAFGANTIDRFTHRMMKRHGLHPAPPAARVTLIRRLSFDLRGLPPTPDEVRDFLADDSEDAYEKLVDRFLADRRFGERMAMHWLDLVRYADTEGYHGDNNREVWLYRDWVLKSFNENLPYDQFTREQLAGDLLPEASHWQRIASGYNALLQTTREGGAQAKEYTAKYAADRVRNVSTVWLGSTMGCCECHDHKFDPFSTRDFYTFAAFFADVRETPVGAPPSTRMPTAEQLAELAKLDARRGELQATLGKWTPELANELAKWEATDANRPATWTVLGPSRMGSPNGPDLELTEGGGILAKGTNPAKPTYTFEFAAPVQNLTGLRLEVLPSDTLPGKGPGRASNGNFVLSEITASLGGKLVAFSRATASHSQANYQIEKAIDGNLGTGWAILPRTGQRSEAVLEFRDDVTIGGDDRLVITLRFEYGTQHAIGHLRFAGTTAVRPVKVGDTGPPANVRAILALAANDRNDTQRKTLADWFHTIAPSLAPVRREIAAIDARRKAVNDAAPSTLITTAVNPRMMRVLPRGNWLDESGPVVEPQLPGFLGKLEIGRRANRLDLANWIVEPTNPLTARVAVNRLWAIAFGRGIVESLDDFGSQGAWPTHPELLDWLAVDFVENGWDVKRSLKQIVMSDTYRQSSVSNAALRRADPYNKWIARQGRWRLDAEMIRDNALAVSGLLNERIGGPSVRPYQPAGYLQHLNFPKRTWTHDANENQYRRGLYTFWQRTFLHPSLLAFDAPSREECTVSRPRSNNPLQALVLLNDPTYVEAARVLAARILAEGGETTQSRLAYGYRRVLARGLSGEEQAILERLLEKHRAEYREHPDRARELLSTGLAKVPEGADAVEIAAWTSVARVLLNLHETITRS